MRASDLSAQSHQRERCRRNVRAAPSRNARYRRVLCHVQRGSPSSLSIVRRTLSGAKFCLDCAQKPLRAEDRDQARYRLHRRSAFLDRRVCGALPAAAVGNRLGISTEKIEALNDYEKSPLFSEAERVALEYADAITDTHCDVDDELFARLRRHCDDDTIAELTMIIACSGRTRPRASTGRSACHCKDSGSDD
jgi:alkylhydroperoxidase family enzyme